MLTQKSQWLHTVKVISNSSTIGERGACLPGACHARTQAPSHLLVRYPLMLRGPLMDLGIQQMRADGEREKARTLHVRLDGPGLEGVYLLLPTSHLLQPSKWLP